MSDQPSTYEGGHFPHIDSTQLHPLFTDVSPARSGIDTDTDSDLQSSSLSTPCRHRAGLKRSFGVLNLSLGHNHQHGSTYTEDSSQQSPSFGSRPPKKRPSVSAASSTTSPFVVNSSSSTSMPLTDGSGKSRITSTASMQPKQCARWRHIFSAGHGSHPGHGLRRTPMLRPQSLPVNSRGKENEPESMDLSGLSVPSTCALEYLPDPDDSPSKSAMAHRQCRQRGPLDLAPFTNPAEPVVSVSSAFREVKPLQTAFASRGLQSKKLLPKMHRRLTKEMPDTPCKRLPRNLVDVSTSFGSTTLSGMNVSVGSSMESSMGDSSAESSSAGAGNPSAAAGTTAALNRSAIHADRAVNTADLQSCILRFTHEFDEDGDGSTSGSSIFCDDHMDEDIALDESSPLRPKSSSGVPVPLPNAGTRTRAHSTVIPTVGSTVGRRVLQRRRALKPSRLQQALRMQPQLSETAPQSPVESMMGLSKQSNMSMGKLATELSAKLSTTGMEEDPYLAARFPGSKMIGKGEFSVVFETQVGEVRYAVKRTKRRITGPKTRMRKLEEVELLKALQKPSRNNEEGREYIVQLADYWEFDSYLYIMTEYCENGTLERFLAESGKISRLDEWRVWKILVELMLGVRYIHNCGILHLDLKPANILISFDGGLKIGDFGVACRQPVPPYFDREGDREYIAPEVISRHVYAPAADIFSCGLILLEVAANIVLPDNGASWQKLRSGDMTDAGRLSSGDLAAMVHSSISGSSLGGGSVGGSFGGSNSATSTTTSATSTICSSIPSWFRDGSAPLDKVVAWMIDPNPEKRPSADQVLKSYECSVVDLRRKSGATIYEGDFGPELLPTSPEDRQILDAEACLEKTRYRLSDMTRKREIPN